MAQSESIVYHVRVCVAAEASQPGSTEDERWAPANALISGPLVFIVIELIAQLIARSLKWFLNLVFSFPTFKIEFKFNFNLKLKDLFMWPLLLRYLNSRGID